ncbi:DUF6404 family protein [uncultured Cohaesibacter sp.]|uniref:DUF6404 family protein n=1 Tax=uncultured Cohaesibacter sp. TaxID=1002546 RepID=UPI0029312B93|nr:DUF6404 family protein [uncultured Cohaesibacter sp.]
MDFDTQYDLAMASLKQTPILEGNYAPPLHRLLRSQGFKIRPPHFSSAFSNILMTGIPFAIVWGFLMWLLVWEDASLPSSIAIYAGGSAGLLFGVMLSIYYRWAARRHELPRWEDLPSLADRLQSNPDIDENDLDAQP